MYQTSIRNKKAKKILKNNFENTYNINIDDEEYAYVIKMLGNCRVNLITNSGNECIGIIRVSLRKFTIQNISALLYSLIISAETFSEPALVDNHSCTIAIFFLFFNEFFIFSNLECLQYVNKVSFY